METEPEQDDQTTNEKTPLFEHENGVTHTTRTTTRKILETFVLYFCYLCLVST